MNRPLSQLIYKHVQEGIGSPRLITLHKHNQYGQDVNNYAIAANPDARIIGLESYKGIYVGRTIVGYTWFLGPLDRPSPLFFGDALAEIERFLWDEINRQQTDRAELPFLIGVEQGAIMALAAAAAVPDLVSGVIAIEGVLPLVPGWSPPLAPLNGLPILLLDSPVYEPADGVLSDDELADTLAAWGGRVTRDLIEPGHIPGNRMAEWLAANPPRHHGVKVSQG